MNVMAGYVALHIRPNSRPTIHLGIRLLTSRDQASLLQARLAETGLQAKVALPHS
jgi:hypothetical protein